jgi:hypothetical protein
MLRITLNWVGMLIGVAAALSTVLSLFESVEPAFAGPAATVPAPVVGVGLPGIAVLGSIYGAIWLTRKLRKLPLNRVSVLTQMQK